MDFSNKYVLGFAFGLCLICSALVSATAVALKDKQDANRLLDQRRQVIRVAALVAEDNPLLPADVDTIFQEIESRVIDRESGGPERLAEAGLTLHALYKRSELEQKEV